MEGQELYEAESMVLGAVFLEPSAISDIILKPEHFSQSRHRIIFTAMRELQCDGVEINPFSLVNLLGNEIENVGGVTYFTEISLCCPSVSGLEHYQEVVLKSYRIGELRKSAAQFLNDSSAQTAEAFYQKYVETQELGLESGKRKGEALVELYESLYADPVHAGISSGYEKLDGLTGGFKPGELIIAAGRPSMGKTALVLNLAYNAASKGTVVDFFSLEMSEKQLYQRLISRMASIDASKWHNPFRVFSDKETRKANEALNTCYKMPFQIHDQGKLTLDEIRARIQKTRRENENAPCLVVIDYLQLIPIEGKFERHDLAIGSITRELKQMAKQYKVPIILLSQLSRSVEQRQDKRPMMSDLRDSGSIEQDADIVMLLYREAYYKRGFEGQETEINLVKHRNGPVGTVGLKFVKEFSWFVSG
ncbi:replicative DNA helicase [Rossellomorea vietnamensis]|uniref:DNA 5'-3' helicase n=2 Tax=Rossellomorea vietnamensis TaxID=218284 RepID=A0A5D4NS38_9BACI|nr:replicative DNA helicase [Rossellomorea vietnamensis]